MKDIKEKITYIYYHTDGLYFFISHDNINDHAKRCILRRFFILVDSYVEMIGFFKNKLFRENIITRNVKQSLENEIKEIKEEWDHNYEIIRNKFSAHHQDVNEKKLLEWWNEIDYSTISFFYEGMSKIRAILTQKANILTITPTDYTHIDFRNTCLKKQNKNVFYVAHDRLGVSKENTVSLVGLCEFQRKCMLILSIVDFVFINCAVTIKTQDYETHYKRILFDSAWLLLVCDTVSLLENMYEDGEYGNSLLSLCPPDWQGKLIIENSNASRDKSFEDDLTKLRNKFAAHIDSTKHLYSLINLFEKFNLNELHKYCMYHMQSFQQACHSEKRTQMFSVRDLKLSEDILGLSYSGYRNVDN
jgi:hypothetical protein